jgi:hypothetical protein
MGLMNEQSTFRIGAQTVEFSSAVFEDFDGAVIKNGDLVEVKGSVVNNSDWLIADEVELEDNDLAETDEFEIEGLITDLTSSEAFNVLGHPVTTNPSTTTFDGGTASELAIDVKVEVEGTVVDDVLVATKVEFKKVEDTRFEAVVDTKNEDLNQLTVLGVTFKVTANTQMEDDSDFRVTSFGLDDISDGDFVEIRGKLEADGTVTVTRLERDDLDDETSVRGNVQSNEDDILVIAGVTIVTTSQTEYRDSLDMSIDKATFFAAALFGVEVDAEGQETDTNQITATELQLEDDD